ncbi:MAG: SNF2-related protein [Nocardioides sp.]
MSILAAMTDEALEGCFDWQTLQRGKVYAGQDRVGKPALRELSSTSISVVATVTGTTTYIVNLFGDLETNGSLWLSSRCTCPVSLDCKHGAALALTLRDSFVAPRGTRQWESTLRGLVDELEHAEPAVTAPSGLALQFTLDKPRIGRAWLNSRPTVRVRPLRMGARGKWIKTGADWRDLDSAEQRGSLDRDQAEILLRMLAGIRNGQVYPGSLPALGDFDRHLVVTLSEAAKAGVTFLAEPPLQAIELIQEKLPTVAEVTAAGQVTSIRLGIDHNERFWHGEQVQLFGDPANTVGLLDDGVLCLGALERSVSGATARMLREALDIDGPSTDAFANYLRPMSRYLTVRSPDGSVALPGQVRPVARARVVWRSSTRAELTWWWRYAERTCEMTSNDPLDGLRDRRVEAEIRLRLPPHLARSTTLTDGDALALAISDLEVLRAIEDVEVIEEERPDFRESSGDPQIEFGFKEPTDDGVRRNDWLGLEILMTVEGESIPLPSVLEALTKDLGHVILPSGLYLSTARPEFDRLREAVELAAQLRDRDGELRINTDDLSSWGQLAEMGIVSDQARRWVARAQALREIESLPVPDTTGVTTQLRHYQVDGLAWLAFLWDQHLGGILADDMGLGKTLQVLALIQHASNRGIEAPFLVVCPTSVVSAWLTESERHTPGLRVAAVASRNEAIPADVDIVVTTYTVLRLAEDRFAAQAWSGLILDEAHNVKNHTSKSYAAVRRIQADFRLAVTGTPFENRLMELWSLLSITNPGLYPWPKEFKERVSNPVERHADAGALHRFRRRIRPFMLRRTKELVAKDLPPKQEQVLAVDLSARHRKIYDSHLAKERQRILGLVEDWEHNRVAIFSALTTLRQLAIDPALVDPENEAVGSAKLDLLVEHLTEIVAEGHKALVFSQFTSFLKRVRTRLDGEQVTTQYLDGGTRNRPEVIQGFRDSGASAFLISLKAGGVGLTLTEADYVFVLDPWWNPASEAQAVDRAHRIGQDKHVHVYRLISTDTIEEKVMELKAKKAELFDQVVDGDGMMTTAVTAEDIRALFD